MRNITGTKIRQARSSKHITQEDLAIRLQMIGLLHTRNTIAKIESGVRQIMDYEVKAIAGVLGVSVSWLFSETNDENN